LKGYATYNDNRPYRKYVKWQRAGGIGFNTGKNER